MTHCYKNTRIITGFLTFVLAFLFTVCPAQSYTSSLYEKCVKGNNVKKTIKRELPVINILEISGPFTVNVKSSHIEQYVKISGDENILDLIKTVPQGNRLVIFQKKPICSDLELTIDVAAVDLVALVSTNAGDITISDINTPNFSLVSKDSGDITLAGNTYLLSAEVSGENDLEAGNLQSREIDLHISGYGQANVRVSDILKVNIVGLSDVYYSGSPKKIIKTFIGAGTLIKIE